MIHASGLTALSFGGGQDSTAILYRLIFDPKFREIYAPNHLVVAMADTGNEHPKTYLHVKYCEKLCKRHDIPFFLITPDIHTDAWQSLLHQYRKNNTCGSAGGFRKTLPVKLLKAVKEYGHMTDDELYDYKMSHGHCVATAY
jgi:tRNA(Ile)-lysidine synthase TilS/MesJ